MDRVLCVILCIVVIVVAVCILAYCGKPTAEATAEPTTAETTEAITEPTKAEEPTEEATEPTEIIPAIPLYDVPLDTELQLYIIHTAEEKRIDPAIIMAMAFKESTYRVDAVGDGGNSYGLLQVQPKWHYERMQKLGCTDLLDPYQNVTVAVDYLCELLNRYGSMDKALTAYNRGSYNGAITQYAENILAYAKQINNERSH